MSSALRHARWTAWGLTWLVYASYYLGRKGLSVTKSTLESDLGVTKDTLGAIDTGYLLCYAVGQFVHGAIGDRFGARRLLSLGMLCSAAACVGFGLSTGAALMIGCFALNGFAQASGWPGTTRAMTEWTTRARRGTVMGVWATCYQVGGAVATVVATWLLVRFGWQSSFFVPAVWLVLIALAVALVLKTPREVIESGAGGVAESGGGASLPTSDDETERVAELQAEASSAATSPDATGESPAAAESRSDPDHPFRRPELWSYGASYFCIKLIRYSLLFWLPYYLAKSAGLEKGEAGYTSTAFEVGGIAGVVVIGFVSDRVFRARRALWAILSLIGLAGALGVLASGVFSSPLGFVIVLVAIGASLFGPDSLISGAAAQDAGGTRHAAKATGFVNGLGSVGAILQGPVTVGVSDRFGWQSLFYVFVGLALFSALCLLPSLRVAPRRGAT